MQITAHKPYGSIRKRDDLREYIVHPGKRDLQAYSDKEICCEYLIKTSVPTSCKLTGDNKIDNGFEHYCDMGHTAFVVWFRTIYVNGDKWSHVEAHITEIDKRGKDNDTREQKTIDLGAWYKLNPCYALIPHLIRWRP